MLKNIWSLLTLGSLLVISVISCVKEENKIGDDLINGQNTVTLFTDTIEISTRIKIVDSVKSANLNYSTLGAINDPKFGKTSASLYSELFLEQNNIDFGSSATLDSIVLILPYLGYYGDTTSNQSFKIYEVNETIDTFKVYSNQSYTTSDLIGDYTFNPHPVKSGTGSNEKFGELRIPLLNTFGQKIFSKSGQPELENDDNFKAFIKGIAIIPDNNQAVSEGALFTFDYQKIKARMFYSVGATQDSINFVFTNSTQHLNTYNHFDYQNSEAALSFGQLNAEDLYIQGLAGLEIEVDFPNIEQLQDSLGGESVAINRAVLQVHRSTDTLSNFKAPNLLLVNEYRKPSGNDAGDLNYYQILDGNKVGGLYNTDENLYNFTITRYFNQRLKGLSSEKLYLRSYSYRALERVILSGVSGADDNKKMKLNVVYTVNDN